MALTRSFILPLFVLTLFAAPAARGLSLRDLIGQRPELSLFKQGLEELDEIKLLLNDTSRPITVFAPSNDAIQNVGKEFLFENSAWIEHLNVTIKNHVILDQLLSSEQVFDGELASLRSMQGIVKVHQVLGKIQEATFATPNVQVTNGTLHIIDNILIPAVAEASLADLESQNEFGPAMGKTSLVDVVDFVGARSGLEDFQENGRTFLGCDIRAFGRVNDYLPALRRGDDIVLTELLNENTRDETRHNFVEYNILKKNFYYSDFYNGFVALTLPESGCGHMWISSKNGRVCFNNACVVESPNPRTYLASNGVGYVLDKCLVCPGIAMLVDYAADFTPYNTHYTAQLFEKSGWSLRDLSLSVGSGGPLTLFTTKEVWSHVSQAELDRLLSDEWKMHRLDLLKHMLVQGSYKGEDLLRLYNEEQGPYNLTTLNGEHLLVDFKFDPEYEKDLLSFDGGILYITNVKGVDGILHVTKHLPKPRSLTHSLYQIGKNMDKTNSHITWIDSSVYLKIVLETMSPRTSLFVTNQAWKGKIIDPDTVVQAVLENHIFEGLLSCETLLSLKGNNIASLNNVTWTISVQDNLPCLEPTVSGGSDKVCISQCDILANNGIAHLVDGILAAPGVVQQAPATNMPSAAPSSTMAPTLTKAPTLAPTDALDQSFVLDRCIADLDGADIDGDGAIRRHEFYKFVETYGQRRCYYPDDALTKEQISLFYELACHCQEQEGALPNCCEGTNAFVDIKGTVVKEQSQYKTTVCEKLHREIDSHSTSCRESFPTPGPLNGRPSSSGGSSGGEGGEGGDRDDGSNNSSGAALLQGCASISLLFATIIQL